MSKKENEKSITTFNELDAVLKPFILKISEAKTRIENLQKGLAEYQRKFELIEKKLTGLLKQSEEALAQGLGPKFSDSIFSAKQEKTDLEEWISQISNESIPAAKVALALAIKELGEKYISESEPLRLSYLERVKKIFDSGDAIWESFISESKGMVRQLQLEHGITFPMYEIGKLFIKPFSITRMTGK